MPLYFAYGANMDRAAMRLRCPRSTVIGRAELRGYRFFISVDGYASVMPAAGRIVHGLAWHLADDDIGALDDYEEVDRGLYARQTLPAHVDNVLRPALVYIGRDGGTGQPADGYLEAVVAAAEDGRLPQSYIDELRSWRHPLQNR